MAVTLNASTSSGFIQTADTSGVLTLQSNGTNALSVSSSNLQFNSGYGSVATAYGCRAWVNFDGTTNTAGFCTIRGSGGVTSVADNGTGNYTINFTNSMPDTEYSILGFARSDGTSTASSYSISSNSTGAKTTSQIQIYARFVNPTTSGNVDSPEVNIAIFR
jgi:hypothetical protein